MIKHYPAWQLIEDAPRDGTPVLCYMPSQLEFGFSREDGLQILYWKRDCWFDEQHDEVFFQPTHWMPLPEPPRSSLDEN